MYKPLCTAGSIICLIIFISLLGCSPKLRLPVEEIKRPLSLPQKNWGLSLGYGLGIERKQRQSYNHLIRQGNIPHGFLFNMFAYPYLPILDGFAEIHFPTQFKFYPIRNLETSDSTLYINGLNWALGGGIEEISYFFEHLNIGWKAYSQFKIPFTNQWLFSDVVFNYQSNGSEKKMIVDAGIGIGYQINRHLYITSQIKGLYRRYKGIFYIFNKKEKFTCNHYWLSLPLQVGFNINNRWKVFVFTRAELSTDSYLTGAGGGFDFYW
ncbi:hypothetical protein CHISP_1460 [Chitinispirillum alkaliphilum]|nr:hypothetical protein CHISP_1460 [Chitinispirillum alkaliphilum]